MHIFIAALLGGLVSAMGSLVGRVLIALGIGYVTYQGLNLLLDFAETAIFSNLLGADSQTIAVMSLLKIGSAVNVIISAINVRLIVGGLTSGAVTKMVIK